MLLALISVILSYGYVELLALAEVILEKKGSFGRKQRTGTVGSFFFKIFLADLSFGGIVECWNLYVYLLTR